MTAPVTPTERLTRLKSEVRRNRPPPVVAAATTSPVAKVTLDVSLAHLDRPFDYSVLESMSVAAVPGCRVKVRFAGRDVAGFILERADHSEHLGQLAPLRRVVSAEPVLTPAVATLSRAVADRYAGSLADVLRLAVPPRHARVEAEQPAAMAVALDAPLDELARFWIDQPGGEPLIRRLAGGEAPRAVWTASPSTDWAAGLAAAAAATRASGRGSIICLPDARDVIRVDGALTALLGGGSHAVLTADLGPAARYRSFLAVRRGHVSIVVGTRAAVFAPVANLGLVAMWDDGDDLFAEPRAPYPHAREVLMLRAHLERASVLFGGHSRSVEAQLLVESGWAVPLAVPRRVARATAPVVHVAGTDDGELERDGAAGVTRMPRRVFEVVRAGLTSGPVLVHTPRHGYQPALACATCRSPARCATCAGPLGRGGDHEPARCRWCGTATVSWSCAHCGARGLRAPVIGSLRTAQEWGRSFPGVPVLTSDSAGVVAQVGDEPALVIATPGAEPQPPPAGYAAAVILDTWLTLSRPDYRAGEEALRRWINAAALVRRGDRGGRVMAVGDATSPALQALIRWDPAGFAARELNDRRSARLPPGARVATLTAAPQVLDDVRTQLTLPSSAETLGPVPAAGDADRIVIRVPTSRSRQLTRALQQLQALRSSRKLPAVRVHVDPDELG